jgi:Fur family ferric uptake transcriptional regulator
LGDASPNHQGAKFFMERHLPDISGLRPAGSKRSTKREHILGAFLQQEGHLSADDLVGLVRRQHPGIGRATVYRTLQWMVDAGIARKVDFGEGRSRFEPAYRHPRHFHLICSSCHRSSEFLSSDVEALMEEIAAARHFTTTQTVVQILGTCEECRTGASAGPATSKLDGATTELVFARDALRIAIATERGGLQFYTRAAGITKDARGRSVFQKLAAEEREHLGTLEKRYAELVATDPLLESRPTFLFFKGAANGLFAAGAEQLRKGVNDLEALLIGIKCERGSHNFFKRYGERFEDSEGKQIFLEFAEEERVHLELLLNEYKALRERQGKRARNERPLRRTAAKSRR